LKKRPEIGEKGEEGKEGARRTPFFWGQGKKKMGAKKKGGRCPSVYFRARQKERRKGKEENRVRPSLKGSPSNTIERNPFGIFSSSGGDFLGRGRREKKERRKKAALFFFLKRFPERKKGEEGKVNSSTIP